MGPAEAQPSAFADKLQQMESRVGSVTKRVLPSVEQVRRQLAGTCTLPAMLSQDADLLSWRSAVATVLRGGHDLGKERLQKSSTKTPTTATCSFSMALQDYSSVLTMRDPLPDSTETAAQEVKGSANMDGLRKKLQEAEGSLQGQQSAMQSVQQVPISACA